MTKRIIAVLLVVSVVLFAVQRASGESPAFHVESQHKSYFPLVRIGARDMGSWSVVVPSGTTNKTLNSSAETTGNFAAAGGATVTRVTTYSWRGSCSYRVQTAADNQGAEFTLSALANAIHYVTLRVYGTLPAAWDWSLDNATYTAPTLVETYGDGWRLYGLQFSAAQANASIKLYVDQSGAGAGDFYMDAIQVEEKSYWTYYADGDQKGCEWNGTAHASTSSRSALSRAGGRVYDLKTDYNFGVVDAIGVGMPPQTNSVDGYAILPGGQLNSIKVQPRVFTLIGIIKGTGADCDLNEARQDLLAILAHDAYPKDADGWQPVVIRYTGADVVKEISAHYEGGLEAAIRLENRIHEKVSIRFIAPDPDWYGIAEASHVLDTNDTATFRYAAGRLKSTGQWDDLGLTANPTTGGEIRAIAVAPDGSVYFGGTFTGMNGVAGRDYVARYVPSTDTWNTVGAGGSVNNSVYAIAIAPNGDVYVGGNFTNLGGANGDYVAYWDVSASTWSPVAAGGIAIVYALAFGLDGTLFIGGSFLNWAGIANADYIALWNGAAYAALGTGMNNSTYALTIGPDGTLYAGGNFTTAGGIAVGYLAQWDDTTWTALNGPTLNATVWGLAISIDGLLYVRGTFTNVGGDANADRMVVWNGTAYSAMGLGVEAPGLLPPSSLTVGPDGMVYIGGHITEAGILAVTDKVAKWNGSMWAYLDVHLPGVTGVGAVAVGSADPVVKSNYDWWVGFDTTGAAAFAGDSAATNGGTASAFPKFIISRSGGTSAELKEIRNETLGLELLFDYDLLDGETLTIDLTPTAKSIVSNFFGPRPDAILANSDFGEWTLQSGSNDVTCFVNVAGAPTVTAFVTYRDSYKSFD